jgi:anti-anti-sigma regulatory factor
MSKAPRTKKRGQSVRSDKAQRVREPLPTAFALPAECTLAGAADLKTNLAPLVSHGAPVTLDGSSVQRIDTASLQLLVAFMRDRRANGLPVEWAGQAPAFRDALSLLGLSAALDPKAGAA